MAPYPPLLHLTLDAAIQYVSLCAGDVSLIFVYCPVSNLPFSRIYLNQCYSYGAMQYIVYKLVLAKLGLGSDASTWVDAFFDALSSKLTKCQIIIIISGVPQKVNNENRRIIKNISEILPFLFIIRL